MEHLAFADAFGYLLNEGNLASADCKLCDFPLAEMEIELQFHRASGELACDIDRDCHILAFVLDTSDSRMRLIFFARFRDPAFDCFDSDNVLFHVTDGCICRKAGRSSLCIKIIRRIDVTGDRFRQKCGEI